MMPPTEARRELPGLHLPHTRVNEGKEEGQRAKPGRHRRQQCEEEDQDRFAHRYAGLSSSALTSRRGGGWTRTAPFAACTTFVETLPSLIRPVAPRSRLPTATKVLSGASSSAASRREAAASPTTNRTFGREPRRLSSSRDRSRRAFSALRSSSCTIRGFDSRPSALTFGNRG